MKRALKYVALVSLACLLVCAGGLGWLWHEVDAELRAIDEEVARAPLIPQRKVTVLATAHEPPPERNDEDMARGLIEAELGNDGPPGFGILTAWDGRVIYTCDLKLDGKTRLAVGGWVRGGVPTFDPMVTVPMRMKADDPLWVVAEERPGAVAWARISDLHVEATLPASGRRASCRIVEDPPALQAGDPEEGRKAIAEMKASNEALAEVLGVEMPQVPVDAP